MQVFVGLQAIYSPCRVWLFSFESCLALALVMVATVAQAEAPVQVGEILRRMAESYDRVNLWHIESETRGHGFGNPDDLERTTYIRQGSSRDIRKEYYFLDKQGQNPEFISRSQWVAPAGGHVLNFQTNSEKDSEEGYVQAFTTGNEIWKERMPLQAARGQALEGIFNETTTSLSQIASKSPDAFAFSGMDKVDGLDCYVLDVSTPETGRLKIWLSKENGYLPQRVEATQEFSAEPATPQDGTASPEKGALRLSKVETVFHDPDFEMIGDVRVPKSCILEIKNTWSDGHITSGMISVNRTKIDLQPDLDKLAAFKLSPPKGTLVKDLDLPGGLLYQFDASGDLVPYVTNELVSQLSDQVEEVKASISTLSGTTASDRDHGLVNQPGGDHRWFSSYFYLLCGLLTVIVAAGLIIRWGLLRRPRQVK